MPINPYGGSYTTTAGNYIPYVYPYPTSTQQPSNVVNMVLVNSEEEARNYSLSPGSSIFLMDSNNSVFYTKSVDFSGISTFKKYQFQEVTDSKEKATDDYITREEFEEWKKSMNRKPYYKKEQQS